MAEPRLNTTHKIKATSQQLNQMLSHYQGYLTYNTSEYTIARAKLSHATITFYKTNVVLFQGEKEAEEYNYWAKLFGLPLEEVTNSNQINYFNLSCVGSDEVGTGDYFGPIVVCATYVNTEQVESLKRLGVKDSKLLTDKQIINLALKLSEILPYSIMFLEPKRLNNLSKAKSNFNFLKSYLHNKVIISILKKIKNVKCDAILIDEFTPKDKYFEYLENEDNVFKNVTMIPKGEKAHLAIAAASILARYTFLREINKMNNEYSFNFLKGAGPEVDRTAISFVKAYGWDTLSLVAKLKFANTQRIKDYFSNNPLPKSKQGSINEKDSKE